MMKKRNVSEKGLTDTDKEKVGQGKEVRRNSPVLSLSREEKTCLIVLISSTYGKGSETKAYLNKRCDKNLA